MDKMPWQAVLFQSFPESVAIIYLGLVLVGLKPRWYRVVLASMIFTVASYVIRGLPIPFGIHTLLMLPVLVVVIAMVTGVGWKGGAMAAIVGLFGLLVLESFMTPLLLSLVGVSLPEALRSPWLRVLIPAPQTAVLAVIAYLCYRFNWYLIRADELEEKDTSPF